MNKEEEEFQHDWYNILGIQAGSNLEEINRAARKLSILYHPDKTVDPDAPAKFLLIQKAKDILSDESKKKTIDEHFITIRKRKAYEESRTKEMDATRRKFREALEKKVFEEERKFEPSESNNIFDQDLRKKSKIIEEIRRSNISALSRPEQTLPLSEDTLVKVKWAKGDPYSDQQLYRTFIDCGLIEEVYFDEIKSNCAYVRFASEHSAKSAVEKFFASENLQVTAFKTVTKSVEKERTFSETLENEDLFIIFTNFMLTTEEFLDKEQYVLNQLDQLVKN